MIGSTVSAALAYHEARLSVVPIRADGSKAPAIPWQRLQSTQMGRHEVRHRFAGNVGVGLVCGFGGLEVIDCDDEVTACDYLADLYDNARELYDRLCIVRTPRPGAHIYYRTAEPEGNQQLALAPDEGNPKRFKTIIETRGAGGYAIAPGSPGECHPTGRTYEVVAGELTNPPTFTALERETLFKLARRLCQRGPVVESEPEQTEQAPRESSLLESPWEDFDRRGTWAELLLPAGWTLMNGSPEDGEWRRPGKPSGSMSAATGRIADDGTNLLVVFSSNAYPFEGSRCGKAGKPYSKSIAYALLRCNGDHARAARELRKAGYGSKAQSTPEGLLVTL